MLHTFAICAYKESPYLEECIQSLKAQTMKSQIILATSTPNEYIDSLGKKYNIPVFVNTGESGITQDWNFAYRQCKTKYITIAHQDDVYSKEYVEHLTALMEKSKLPLIAFSDYAELRNGDIIKKNKLLKIKRLMLIPMRVKAFQSIKFVRRRILSFGCPICCPSVMFAKDNLPKEIFQHGFRSNEDWEAWERISHFKGDFLYDSNILMFHRIHEDSETTKILEDSARGDEDIVMYEKFWPSPIAKIIAKLYATSEKSNDIAEK